MQVPILSGVYADSTGDFRTTYPRNYIPVPKPQGISQGYLRPADGIEQIGAGPGADRGGIEWNGICYRVSGTSLVRVAESGAVTALGDVGTGGPVTLDYGFDRLAIASGGSLYYWDGSTLTQVTDADLGTVVDVVWTGGYYVTTDGTSLVVTELTDPTSVNPVKYGSAEADPDPIVAVDRIRTELYALGRYTIEAFQNVGGEGFPFQRIEGAQVPKGVVSTGAYCSLGDTFAFVGSGRNEALAVYVMTAGNVQKISTREIDRLLKGYSDDELADIVMETRVDDGHQLVHIHLPDRCLVYDTSGSAAAQEPIWFTLDSGLAEPAQYRARGLVRCYGQWIVGDPTGSAIGRLTASSGEHHGATVGWEFGTMLMYNQGNGAILNEMELVGLPGRVAAGADPVIWTSYSLDGETWSQERAAAAGRQGERTKRIAWRRQGRLTSMRCQRFRGTSDARMSFARLECQVEPLLTRGRRG